MTATRALDPVERAAVDAPARPRPCRDTTGSSRPDFSVAISRALGTIVVTVHGALSAGTGRQLRSVLWDLIDQHGNRDIVVDLRGMTVADGADVGLFVDASQWACTGGGHLTLSGPCSATAEAFARAGLTDAVDIEPTGCHRPLYRPAR